MTPVILTLIFLAGLIVRAFQGVSSIPEVECSGQRLNPDTSVSAIVLYQSVRGMVASVNLMNRECQTTDSFSSCVVDDSNSRNTRLRTIVIDMHDNERRNFSCQVTIFRSGEGSKIIFWNLQVEKFSKYSVVLRKLVLKDRVLQVGGAFLSPFPILDLGYVRAYDCGLENACATAVMVKFIIQHLSLCTKMLVKFLNSFPHHIRHSDYQATFTRSLT